MDMKKILAAVDGKSETSKTSSGDMKKFLSIINESATNRLSMAEQMAVQHFQETRKNITSPVLNKDKDAKPSMIGKYFKKIEEELAESELRHKERAKQIAERVVNKIHERTADVDTAVKDYLNKGGEVKQGKASKGPRKAGMSLASKHIGGGGDKMKASRTGRASNTQGKPVVQVEDILDNIRQLKNQLDEQISQLEEYYSVPPNDSKSPIPGKHVDGCQCKEVAEGLKDPKDNPCWKGYKPVGTKKKGGRTVPNCVPKESVQKTGPAGQLKAKDKVDVKGTVLGSKEKSQNGLRNKLVGGGA